MNLKGSSMDYRTMNPPSPLNAITDTLSCETVTTSDVTVCIAIRLTNINPWVIERLWWLGKNYEPSPKFLILDLGSSERHALKIRKACESIGAEYHHIDDSGEFSLAVARNLAFERVKTDFVFFTDIDFVFEKRFFGRLSEICNQFEIRRYPLRCFTMPAYHVSQEEALLYESLSPIEQERLVNEWCLAGAQTEFGTIFEFVAPYSNNFLCHRNLFSIVGGYCTEFRGHGFEDFEFFIRLCRLIQHIPMPTQLNKDMYSPLGESFQKIKKYAGFRRMLELFTYPSESIGLKSFHIWHPRPKENEYWTSKKNRNRDRFNKIVSQYIKNSEDLLGVDFLSRSNKALCILEDKNQWRYFVPLRLAGYRLFFIINKNPGINKLVNQLETGKFNRIFILCADSKRLYEYNDVIELARQVNIQVYFAELGAFPNSICFSNKSVSNNLCDYQQALTIENLILDGQRIPCGLGLSRYYFSWRSYVSGHLTLSQDNYDDRGQLFRTNRKPTLRRKLRKLIRSPRQFFLDALIKWL
jgi:predicted glycosyltransferase involved in capsule biosynthesis